MKWQAEEKGMFTLYAGEHPVLTASAAAVADGEELDSRRALASHEEKTENVLRLVYEFEGGLCLEERLRCGAECAEAQCAVFRKNGEKVTTNSLTPLVARGKGDEPYLWRDLRSKMLLVPYDNDMWMRYEEIALRAGARSYDVTVLFHDSLKEALLIGAMDFDVWKNALACPGTDARILEARCGAGASGEGSHDREVHGSVSDVCVASSRFMVLFGEDWRKLLEQYAQVLSSERAPRRSEFTVPFGFNSYAGLGRECNKETFRGSGDFIHDRLMPRGFQNQGQTFINLDGGWQFLVGVEESLRIKDDLHARGQKAGAYDAPFACFQRDLTQELPLLPGHTYEEILLRDHAGRLLPRVDGSLPYDVTHPVWKAWTEKKMQQLLDWGFDYLKIDFLSHGGMEGKHWDPKITTGRQALHLGYELIDSLLDEKRIGRPFFLSLSIAPLFPYGYGNSRRFSCDAFGLTEDIEYVLNAQYYSWWTGGTLYQYNDPDHIVLMRSFCMLRDSLEGEARARYTTGVVCGPMLLLSDDYRREEVRARTEKIAGNEEINALARRALSFRPIAKNLYAASEGDAHYLAVFSIREGAETLRIPLKQEGLREGTWRDLWSGKQYAAEDGCLQLSFEGTDAALLQWQS